MTRGHLVGILLAGLACALNGVGLFDHALWMPDEPREAEIAREYVTREGWVTPWLNGGRWLEKPPLYHWVTATFFRWAGAASPGVARLPSALAGIGIGVCTWLLARRLGPPGLGPWAAFLAWTSAALLNAAHNATVDALFAFFVVLALTAFFLGNGGAWDVLAAAAAGLAFLTKLHLGPLLVGIAILGWMGLQGTWKPMKRLLSPLPILVFFAVVAPWPALLHHHQHETDILFKEVNVLAGKPEAPATRMAPEALAEILWGQLLKRSAGNAYGHAQGPFYYLPNLFTFAAPWSLALVAAIPWGWRRRKEEPLAAFALAWLLGAVLFLSVPKAKRVVYLLPCVPAVSLLVAGWGREALARWEASGTLKAILPGLAGFAVAISAALTVSRLPGSPGWAFALGGIALIALGLALRAPRAGGRVLCGWLVALCLAADAVWVPALDRRESFVPIAGEIRRLSGLEGPRTLIGFRLSENLQGAFGFALGQRIRCYHEPEHLKEELAGGNRLVILPLEAYQGLLADREAGRLMRLVGAGEAHGIPFAIAASTGMGP
jgi:4-amino-4-deoxy-L-arabinose transferase-like glycosyltransferase